MPVSALFPKSVEEKLGEKPSEDLIEWLEVFIKDRAVSRDEYREVLSRLDVIEHDVADLKEEVRLLRDEMNDRFDRMNESINDRFDRMNERFDRMNESINDRFDRMNERFDRMNERFDRMNERLQSALKWMVGVTLGMGSLLAILMSIYRFMG